MEESIITINDIKNEILKEALILLSTDEEKWEQLSDQKKNMYFKIYEIIKHCNEPIRAEINMKSVVDVVNRNRLIHYKLYEKYMKQ